MARPRTPTSRLHIVRDGEPTDLTVFIRGNVQAPGEPTHRGFLTVLSPVSHCRSRRAADVWNWPRRLVSPQNPLTARVFVNRVWAQLVGQPLVETPSNFGAVGQPPSHPELLDDLAASLHGKRMVDEVADPRNRHVGDVSSDVVGHGEQQQSTRPIAG